MGPAVAALVDRLDDWRVLTRLAAGQVVLLLLVAAYMVWLLLMGWISTSIFQTCRRSLEPELFR